MKFAKKSLGQNFLRDQNIIKKIINLVEVKNRNIIEIGPGEGALTEEILKKEPKSLSIIEKDFDLFKKLKIKYFKNKIIKIYNADILRFDIQKLDTKNSAIEYAKKNININCVSPGFIKTEMTEKISEEFKKSLISKIPAGNLGTGEDVSNCVAFLASDMANYINGETIHVNGGMYMS